MFSVYFAGELFSGKHLLGNATLAEAVAKASNLQFICVLPQTFEPRKLGPRGIRDEDLVNLVSCDLAIFNFDGGEVDSGTVVEFLFAKFADIPSLLLRTDFRRAGDAGDDPWNLMMSFYPRTRTLCLNSMEIYGLSIRKGSNPVRAAQDMIEAIAGSVVRELQILAESKPILPAELNEPVYRWLSALPDFQSSESADRIMAALAQKKAKRLL
jgi:nucleoside 2-deoxyribosyltransferase-like protein